MVMTCVRPFIFGDTRTSFHTSLIVGLFYTVSFGRYGFFNFTALLLWTLNTEIIYESPSNDTHVVILCFFVVIFTFFDHAASLRIQKGIFHFYYEAMEEINGPFRQRHSILTHIFSGTIRSLLFVYF